MSQNYLHVVSDSNPFQSVVVPNADAKEFGTETNITHINFGLPITSATETKEDGTTTNDDDIEDPKDDAVESRPNLMNIYNRVKTLKAMMDIELRPSPLTMIPSTVNCLCTIRMVGMKIRLTVSGASSECEALNQLAEKLDPVLTQFEVDYMTNITTQLMESARSFGSLIKAHKNINEMQIQNKN